MSVNSPTKPGYAVATPIVNLVDLPVTYDFPMLLTLNLNEVSFQMQWSATLAPGIISVMASNQDLPVYGSSGDVTYPPPLFPVTLATLDMSTDPFLTNMAAAISVSCGYSWAWIRYVGNGSPTAAGTLSIAYTGKSWG